MQMQPDWLVVVDDRRTVVFRRYVASRGRPAPLAQACRSLVVCFTHSIDDRRDLVDAVFAVWRR